MKHLLPCAVVRDLLPAFAEALTEDETSRLVKEHLDGCENCRKIYERMQENQTPQIQEEQEINYLKNIQKQGRRKIWITLSAVSGCFLLLFMAFLFMIGTPVEQAGIHGNYRERDGKTVLKVDLDLFSSAKSFAGMKMEQSGGIVFITGREVLSSPLNRRSEYAFWVGLEDVKQIQAFGHVIWQDGLFIQNKTRDLFHHRTPYTGDMPALGRLTQYLPFPQAAYSNWLDTEQEPYGWTWIFEETLLPYDEKHNTFSAAVLLSLVENLSYIHWSYPDHEGGLVERAVALEDVEQQLPVWVEQYNQIHHTQWKAKKSVKDYAESVYDLQQYIELCTMQYGVSF